MKKRIFSVFVLFFLVLFNGCAERKPHSDPNEHGFVEEIPGWNLPKDTSIDPLNVGYRCAYKIEKDEYHIDDVSIRFFYGQSRYRNEVEDEHKYQDLTFKLRFSRVKTSYPWYDLEYPIKQLPAKEFFSMKYYYSTTKLSKRYRRNEFTFHETLHIPKHLFDQSEGLISFGLSEYSLDTQRSGSGNSIKIKFRSENGVVVLSVPNS